MVNTMFDEPAVMCVAYQRIRAGATVYGLQEAYEQVRDAMQWTSRGQKEDFVDALRDLRFAITERRRQEAIMAKRKAAS